MPLTPMLGLRNMVLSLPEAGSHYVIASAAHVLTPALALYVDCVDANIATTLRLLDNDATRWRPHVKTAKLRLTMRRLVTHGVTNFKCATSLELLTVCEAGGGDVLVASPVVGPSAQRVVEIAKQFPHVSVSALVENTESVQRWRAANIGLFIDLNPGMDRTGIECDRMDDIVVLARAIVAAGIRFRGLHCYEGHLSNPDLPGRIAAAHAVYARLLQIEEALAQAGIAVPEIITSGTPGLPCSLQYERFQSPRFVHRVSPGTVVYGDATSLAQLPPEYGYVPAALVVTTVVSHPAANVITCDAGHKTLSADAGVPNCVVLGHPELEALAPSEEHLPLLARNGGPLPAIGQTLYLLPRHICPTVNNFGEALIIRDGDVAAIEPVSARGREAPMQPGDLRNKATRR